MKISPVFLFFAHLSKFLFFILPHFYLFSFWHLLFFHYLSFLYSMWFPSFLLPFMPCFFRRFMFLFRVAKISQFVFSCFSLKKTLCPVVSDILDQVWKSAAVFCYLFILNLFLPLPPKRISTNYCASFLMFMVSLLSSLLSLWSLSIVVFHSTHELGNFSVYFSLFSLSILS